MRILFVGTGNEISLSNFDTCRFGFNLMRKEIMCPILSYWELGPTVLMWHDARAAERCLPPNGAATRIVATLNKDPAEHFHDVMVRGGVFFTGPRTKMAEFTGLQRTNYEAFIKLLRTD
jgi:hypothetical protein